MAEIATVKSIKRKKILLIDDDNQFRTSTSQFLEKTGYEIQTAADFKECISTLRYEYFDLLVLSDNIPGELHYEDVISEIRKFNPYTRIILIIQRGENIPDAKIMQQFDIFGYFEKSANTGTILAWIEAGIKTAGNMELLNKSRKGLRYLLSLTPDIYKVQSQNRLLQDMLRQLSAIFGITDCFIAIITNIELGIFHDPDPRAFIHLIDESQNTSVCIGAGKFHNNSTLSQCITGDFNRLISDMLETRSITGDANASLMPVRVEDQILGVIYFAHSSFISIFDTEMMNLFTDQVALAVQNVYLHEIATIDRESGVFINNSIDRFLIRELWFACNMPKPLTVILVQLPDLHEICKKAGKETCGRILTLLGSIFRSCTRLSDYIGRTSDDEFMLILPDITRKNAPNLCNRIFNAFNNKTIESPAGDIRLKIHIGVCGIEKTQAVTENTEQPFYLYYRELRDTLIGRIIKTLQDCVSDSNDAAIFYADYVQ